MPTVQKFGSIESAHRQLPSRFTKRHFLNIRPTDLTTMPTGERSPPPVEPVSAIAGIKIARRRNASPWRRSFGGTESLCSAQKLGLGTIRTGHRQAHPDDPCPVSGGAERRRVVHDRDSLGIEDRVHIMVDISDDTKIVQRRAEVTGAVRRRRWSDEEKGRIVAESDRAGCGDCGVARRHDVELD